MLKQELRKIYLEKRNKLSSAEVEVFSKKIFESFVSAFPVSEKQNIHIFQSISKFKEIDTSLFINYFFEKGARVFVPKMKDANLLSIEILPETEMVMNSWGIAEPASDKDSGVKIYDYVITPLLYCDQNGNRVGYGKGFYDRFFAGISAESKKIGVGFFPPQEMVEDVIPSDVALDYLVTPTEILSF